MSRPEEDEAWRAIVENYGERASLDDLEEAPAPPLVEPDESRFPSFDNVWRPDPEPVEDEVVDRFVPPDPPVPIPAPARLAAWIGVFGAPALLLLSVVLAIPLPGLVSGGLLVWFVAGFAYLFWQMPNGPSDPWDNGARV